jgi:arylsulfatase A-like enzyme
LSPRHPLVPAWEDAEENLWQQRRMEVYAAQVTCMDRNIGRITDYLLDAGSTDNTMVVYQHDNGGCHVEYGKMRKGSWSRDFTTDGKKTPIKPGNVPGLMPGSQATFQSYGYGWANASNTPFRLFKQYDHEGGTHSPLIISWPAGMAKKRKGKLAGEVCHVIDIMPTLLDIAGVNFSEQQSLPFEGRSFAPVLQGKRISEHAEIFWGHAHGKAVLQGDWKLVSADRAPWELYHLSEDGTELHDLAREMPEKLNVLKTLHAAWVKRTNLNLETK